MNCRALIFYAIFMMLTLCPDVHADGDFSKKTIDWSQFQTENMKIQNDTSGEGDVKSTYPLFMQTIYARLLGWEPRVNNAESSQKQKCQLNFSSTSDLKTRLDQLQEFQNTKAECVYKKEANQTALPKKLLQALSVHFDVKDNTHFRKVIFELPASQQTVYVRGLLGLQDDQQPRPLLILRLGVHGNIDELLAERFIAKLAYEDFKFNFLILENLTSHGYLSEKNPITFAGVEEGLHTFYILNEIKRKNPKLNRLITDIHLLGVSLGGHGLFVTTMLDELNHHDLKSTTGFCPMINLEKTMMAHSDGGPFEAGVDLWNHLRLKAIPARIPALQDTGWWKTFFDFKPRFMPAILNYINTSQKSAAVQLPSEINWPKGFKQHLESSKTFFELNDFWPYFENNKTPLLIVTTPNDPLVPNALNSNLILNGQQKGQFKKTQILQLDQSVHCALPTEYEWSFVIDILKTQWQ